MSERRLRIWRVFIVACVVIVMGGPVAYGQKEGRDQIDSLEHELVRMKGNNGLKASLYEKIGMEFYFMKEYDSATLNFSSAGDIYEEAGNRYGVERAKQMTQQIEQNKSEAGAKRITELAVVAVIVTLVVAFILMVRKNKREKQARQQAQEEKRKGEELLLNILPAHVAHQLRDKGMIFSEQFKNVTVIFSDFVSFTKVAERFSPNQLVGELHTCFKAFDEALEKFNMEKIKTVGDAYLAVAGLTSKNKNHAADAIAFGIHMQEVMRRRRQQMGDATFDMRVGLHSGSVIGGIVGVKKFAYDIWGDTVNIAARMEQNCEPGEVNVSQATYDLAKDKYDFLYRGEIDAKNKGMLKMYYVMSHKDLMVKRKSPAAG